MPLCLSTPSMSLWNGNTTTVLFVWSFGSKALFIDSFTVLSLCSFTVMSHIFVSVPVSVPHPSPDVYNFLALCYFYVFTVLCLTRLLTLKSSLKLLVNSSSWVCSKPFPDHHYLITVLTWVIDLSGSLFTVAMQAKCHFFIAYHLVSLKGDFSIQNNSRVKFILKSIKP